MDRMCLFYLLLGLRFCCGSGDANKSVFACDDNWPDDPVLDNSSCTFSVSPDSVVKFTNNIQQNRYNFIRMSLIFDRKFRWTRCVIQPQEWIWTFDGVDGGKMLLSWPVEYNILSLGLLGSDSLLGLPVNITTEGKCSIIVGKRATTTQIAKALANMTANLMTHPDVDSNKYYTSVWCYKERVLVLRHKWLMCRYMICPFEAIGYRCCHWEKYRQSTGNVVKCVKKKIELKWFIPFVIAGILYLYSPIILFGIAGFFYDLFFNNEKKHLHANKTYGTFPSLVESELLYVDDLEENEADDWESHDVIFFSPIKIGSGITIIVSDKLCHLIPSRCLRFLFICLSLSLIAFKLLLYYHLEYSFVVDSVRQQVPMGFLSILAKYSHQRWNYLPCFGGPIPALFLFVVFSTIFMCTPQNLSAFLLKGVPDNNGIARSPLTSGVNIKAKYGVLKCTRNINDYKKIKLLMIAQFFMIVNPKFWLYCLTLQKNRWIRLVESCQIMPLSCIFTCLFLPILLILNITELLLSLLYFGIPSTFFHVVCLRAYSKQIWFLGRNTSFPCKIALLLITVLVVLILLMLLYLYSIIFMDSFVFIFQLLTYTYTGLFTNPNFSYGYIILFITVIMYIFDSIGAIHAVYDDLFVQIREVCKRIFEKNKYPGIKLIYHVGEYYGIPRKMFFYVVKKIKPLRKEICTSLLKISILIFVLYISVRILAEFKNFQRMPTLLQIVMTLFVCLVPKIMNSFCHTNETKWRIQSSIELRNAIHYYCRREIRKQEEEQNASITICK